MDDHVFQENSYINQKSRTETTVKDQLKKKQAINDQGTK